MSALKQIDILPTIEPDYWGFDSGSRLALCPVCKSPFSHAQKPEMYTMAGPFWNGDGELAAIPMEGECGSKWEICVGQHKGNSPIFVRVIASCPIYDHTVLPLR